MVELRRCPTCKQYTLQEQCPQEGEGTRVAHPAKYSPQDRWALYRRKEKYPALFAKDGS